MWDERYSEDELAYGEHPNDFLKECVDKIPAESHILCLAEGQGRNAVFLAQHGHHVTAVDQSLVGMARAEKLASSKGVTIKTEVADLNEFDFGENQWDVVISIAAHMPPALRAKVHAKVKTALKPTGMFILEAYCPAHIDLPGVGGPPNPEMLMPLDVLHQELDGLAFEIAHETERHMEEGQYHYGLSGVVQILARKPK